MIVPLKAGLRKLKAPDPVVSMPPGESSAVGGAVSEWTTLLRMQSSFLPQTVPAGLMPRREYPVVSVRCPIPWPQGFPP